VPASPAPLKPPGRSGAGVSKWWPSMGGRFSGRGDGVVHQGAGDELPVLVVDTALEKGAADGPDRAVTGYWHRVPLICFSRSMP
jgi:hypothetical protein